MEKCIFNFNRIEKKYIISQSQKEELLKDIRTKIKEDCHGSYIIFNLYMDTPDYYLIRSSIDKPIYKEKLRIRSYGLPRPESIVFLEIKKKYKGQVSKRRIEIPYGSAIDYVVGNASLTDDGQIEKEIDWLKNKYYGLGPMMFLSYERNAYSALDNKGLRITFDTNLIWRDKELSLMGGNYGNLEVCPDKYIMEIKSSGAMPLWLSSKLAQHKIYPTSFSKVGYCYKKKLLKDKKGNEGGGRCA